MMNYKDLTPKEVIKQYYGDECLYKEYEDKADEILQEMDHEKIKEECLQLAAKKEKEVWHIGKWEVNKVAGLAAAFCIFTILCGFGYVVISGYIKELRVEDKGDHGEIQLVYNHAQSGDEVASIPSKIEYYYAPIWVPKGYSVSYSKKRELSYQIIYEEKGGDYRISYYQYLPMVKLHLSTENGNRKRVAFGQYSGEFIETEYNNYLVVTDGIYLYSLISDNLTEEQLIKMLYDE